MHRWSWAMGAVLGALLALVSVLRPQAASPIPDDAVATVNGRPIARGDYERALAGLLSARRSGVDAELRAQVLERLIEQELLVQHGLELGLAERDPKVRLDLGSAVIDLLSARGAHLADPSDEELRRFHRERASWFTRAEAAEVEVVRVAPRTGETEAMVSARAEAVAQALRTDEPVASRVEAPILEVPAGMLPIAKLRDYLGDSVARAITHLRAGEVSEPLPAAGGYHLVRVVDRRDSAPEPFERVRDQVVAAWRREAGDRRLRSFLDARRQAAQVVVAEVL